MGYAVNKIFKELKTTLPAMLPSLSSVTSWSNRFKRGAEELKDKHSEGRPITETIQKLIEFGLFIKTIHGVLIIK